MRRRIHVLATLAMLLGLAGLMPLATSTAAVAGGTADVSAGVDPAHGYPSWYQDQSGIRLQPCLDPTDPNCVVLPGGTFGGQTPLSFPDNFPDEFFYTVVDSDPVPVAGCGAKAELSVRMALEGAFANGPVVPGDQMVFGRVRFTGKDLCPFSTYTVTYPFGQTTVTTDDRGRLPRNENTTDIGCVPVAPTPCDWRVALGSPVATSFLRWDPAVAPAAPAGYLGDAVTPHAITGATFTAPGETKPANYVKVTGQGASSARTDLFTVSGKLAGPLSASPSSLDFGGQPVGQTSETRQVVLTNLAQEAITPGPATVSGANASDFAVATDRCADVSLARDASCSIDLTFTPGAEQPRQASLVIPHTGVRSPFTLALAGTGTAATAQATAAVSPTSVDFGEQRVGTLSARRNITLSSTGTAPLEVSAARIAGDTGQGNQFSIATDGCTDHPVAVGSTCTVSVAFNPTVAQPADATLLLTSNDPTTPDVSLHGQGTGGVAAVSPTIDGFDRYPDWYQDERGVRLAQCIDPEDPNCTVLPGGTFAGQTPLSFPDNFPDEYFYNVADSDIITTPGCDGTAPGKAMIRMAVEGAFGGGDPLPGDQMTFGRIRIKATGGLCPNTTYTFVHPYGIDQLTTDVDGAIKPSAGTEDVGCLGATPDTPCDFSLAVKSRVFGGFLRWDPTVAPAAPAGYLGDAATLHKIVGAPFTAPGETSPANSFRIYQGDQLIGETDLFTVMGKLAGPLVANPAGADFGGIDVGQAGQQTVTLSNQGVDDLTVNGAALRGAQAADFTVVDGADHCTGVTLAKGGSCTLDVSFAPSAVGERNAQLVVDHTGLNNPMQVDLSGIGRSGPGTPALSVTREALGFADLHVGRTAVPQTVTVSNKGGSAPLLLTGLDVTGPDAADFTVVGNGCRQQVQPGETCALRVGFSPSAAGARQATLQITSDTASPTTVSVALDGTGFAGAAGVSPTVRPDDGFPTWYQDSNGVRLAPCLDPADTKCLVLGGAGFDPARPLSFPDNYPPEFFYAVADSTLLDTPGCAGTPAGTAMLRLALEGTFASGAAQPDQQTTFGRIRFNVTSGLCPNTEYTFTTPYGDITATTDAAGAVARNVGTTDVGCGGTPCDFASAVSSPVVDSFVRWAPGVGPDAPAGYLGDAVTPHVIVGATHTVAGSPANYFEITGPDGSVGRTDKFLVSGKLASGLLSQGAAFSDQKVGTTSTVKTVTFTNIGGAPVTVSAATVDGPNAAAFSIVPGGTCLATPVAVDGTCSVAVEFAPKAIGAGSAVVRLVDAGGGELGSAPVSGQGTDPGVARATVPTASLTFPAQRFPTTSGALSVQVNNTGNGALVLGQVSVSGAQAADFSAAPGAACAQPIAPGAGCTIAVSFTPSGNGSRTATLTIPSNDPTGARTVRLSGTGVGGQMTLRSATLDLGRLRVGRRPVTKSVLVRNSGTAPLNISAVTVDDPSSFSVSLGTCTAALAPGRSCNIRVTLLAQPPVGVRTSVVRFTSNAVNSPTLKVTGRLL